MSWGTSWDDDTETDVMELPPETEDQKSIVKKLKKRYTKCVDWEAEARNRFDYDVKFANGDTHNKFQWDSTLVQNHELQDRPVLTINKTQQHNLLVINDAKQNKPGVRIRPVSDEATFDGAEVYQELVYHTEYISNAETVYDAATTFQVEGGIGYWRIVTDWVGDDSFDQEIYIRHIKDPRSVYLDPDINEIDGSDARFGIIFEDMSNDIFKEEYPKYASLAGSASTLGNDGWLNKDDIRVAEYYYKEEKQDKLVTWTDDNGQVLSKVSKLQDMQLQMYKELKKLKVDARAPFQFRERNIVTDSITWCKIAGDRIIKTEPWLGKYIPIVRLIGTETIIDGQLDRKGHTRALINAQQMYNYNSPLALDTPLPTPNGWTTMGKVMTGDWLFDEKGNPVQVFATSPILFNRKCYRVEFDDGSHIIADENHLWTVEEKGKLITAGREWIYKTLPTSKLEADKKHFIELASPLYLEEKRLPIDPYVLGAWLGDGTSANNAITSGLSDMHEMSAILAACGYKIGEPRIYSNSTAATITIHGLRDQLAKGNLLNNKHIPVEYLRASYEQRLALLQGLMDTDGHIHKQVNQCIFVTTNQAIADGFNELLRSLNIKSKFKIIKESSRKFPSGKTYDCQASYRFTFSVGYETKIFRLNRKAEIQNKIRITHPRRTKRYEIVKIEEVASVPVKCVTIQSHSHLFLAGKGMVPTHNSANIEYGALQTKAPWLAPSAAITNFEEYYKTANTENHSYIPYNHMDENGNPIPPPSRPQPPQPGTGYIEGLKIAANEMMMVSGQWQSQIGENENAKSGVAINARQRQGDRATYHFLDNQAIAIRFTGKILIDLYPKIYDTKRVKQILARDGTKMNVQIDPKAPTATQQLSTLNADKDHSQQIEQIIFNPNVGTYDVRADTGPSFATRRMEAFSALTQLATAPNSNLMQIGGDLFFKVADFPEADILAERYRRTIPPNILGDTPDPHIEQAMHQASDKIEQLTAMVGDLTKKLADKDKEIEIKAGELELRTKEATVRENRLDYEAENKRLTALGNSGPGVSMEQIQPVIKELIRSMMNAQNPGSGDIHLPGPHEGGTPIALPEGDDDDLTALEGANGAGKPPIPGARMALDGKHYVKIGGQYHRVEPAEANA